MASKMEENSLFIINGTVYTMTEQGEIADGCVLVMHGIITYVGERCSAPKVSQDIRVIDAKGGMIMPGIIEAHCHIGITEEKKGVEGDDCNEMTDPVTPFLRALDGINPLDPAFHQAIQAGITSVMAGPGSANVVGGQFVFMKTHGRSIDEMIVKAPAAMKVAFGENPKREYGEQGKMPATRMGIAALLREQLFLAKQYMEAKQKLKGDDFKEDFRLEPWIPVLEGKIPLKAHAHRTDDIVTAIRIAREFHLSMTLDHCTEGHLIAEQIRESGFPAICGPYLSNRNKLEIQNADFKTPGILTKAGVLVAITTDHPVSLIQYLPLCAALAVKKGMKEIDALHAITRNAAKICRVENRVGSLSPQLDADIVIFNGSPLKLETDTLYTIINGKVVYEQKNEHNLY